MKIFGLKKMSVPKVAVLATGLTAAVLVATINPAPAAQAYPSKNLDCAGCHTASTSTATTAVPSTTTPAAGDTYTVAITLEDNPGSGNSGYAIIPATAGTGTTNGGNAAADVNYTATMTAPAAVGTYKYTVYTNMGSKAAGKTGSATYSITVGAASTVVTTTTALAVSPTSPAVAPASPTLTATVDGAGAAGNVEFFDGATSLGTIPVASGTAVKALTGIAAGSYSYHAVFTPTVATAFTSSTSGNTAFTVTAAPPVTTETNIPGAPTNVTATPGNGSATVSWDAPKDNGGLPILGYLVLGSDGESGALTDGAETTVMVPELTNGTSYTFTVVAFNGLTNFGSEESAASNAVTPRDTSAPTGTGTGTGTTTPPVTGAGDGTAVIPVGAPDTGAGGASNTTDGPLVGLGGLALLIAGAGATQVIRRRQQV